MKWLADSRYKNPYIVYRNTLDWQVGPDGAIYKKIEHGLPFIPLLIGQWSLRPDFSPSYDLGVNFIGFYGPRPEFFVEIGADERFIHFSITNNTQSTLRFYFRLMSFENPDYYGEISRVHFDPSLWRFHSKYNLMKIFARGRVNGGEVRHGLGYIPQVKVWQSGIINDESWRSINVWRPASSSAMGNRVESGVIVDPEKVKFIGGDFYYYLFKDEV